MSLACYRHKRFSGGCPNCLDNKRNGAKLHPAIQVELRKLRAQRISYESALESVYETYCDSLCWFTAEMALKDFDVPLPKMPWEEIAR